MDGTLYGVPFVRIRFFRLFLPCVRLDQAGHEKYPEDESFRDENISGRKCPGQEKYPGDESLRDTKNIPNTKASGTIMYPGQKVSGTGKSALYTKISDMRDILIFFEMLFRRRRDASAFTASAPGPAAIFSDLVILSKSAACNPV